MSRKIILNKQFKRDLKKHYLNLISTEWAEIINCLANDLPLHEKYKDHPLTGNFTGYRDVHVKNDLVLIYKINGNKLELHRLGTHAQVFG